MLLFLGCHGAASIVANTDSGAVPDSGEGTVDSVGDTGRIDSGDSGGGDSSETGSPDSGVDTGAIEIPPACPSWGAPVQTGSVVDWALDEISGVAPSYVNPGALWVILDHGNTNEIYALDETGRTLATIVVDGAENVDWEDIDLVPCDAGTCLVIADTGDNEHVRTDLALLVIEEPLLDGSTEDFTLPATRYGFTWPLGGEDNESLTHTQDGRFVMVSKRTDATAGVYTLPMFVDGAVATSHGQILTVEVVPEGEDQPAAPVTSAAMWPDDRMLLVRTYPGALAFALPDGIDGAEASTRVPIPSPAIPHVEAVGIDVVLDGFWTMPEADPETGSPIWFVPCVR